MEYSFLGKSDLNISKIGFGCMSLKPSQPDVQWLIDEAIDNGINYFDTADLYDKGLNESMIGQALKHHRSKIIIATKGGNEWKKDGSGWDWNPTKEYLINLLLLLTLAILLIIKVIIPITGTPIKKIKVPQANTDCHPSLSTKFFKGNKPIAAIASPNKATIKASAMQPKIKYTKTLKIVTIILPKTPLDLFAAW